MSKLLASVLINNCNYERFLRDAIDSALAQTYRPLEVIVVDDGSTDGSRQVIESYGTSVIPVFQQNSGQASAFTAGFMRSSGEVVLFLDADDMLLPTAVEVAANELRDRNVSKVHWQLIEVDASGERTGKLVPGLNLAEGSLREEVIRHGHTLAAHSPTSGNAYPRWFLEKVMPVREPGNKHGADAYLCWLAPVFGRIALIRETQSKYRKHGSNYSGFSIKKVLRRDIAYLKHNCQIVHEYLTRSGVSADLGQWMGPGTYYAWMCEALAISDELEALMPPAASFVLVDGDQFGAGFVDGRTAHPFTEQNGLYWGPPHDDAHAISELERMRQAGASYIVFVRPTFWWLDQYPVFKSHLDQNYNRIQELSDAIIVFDLQSGATARRG